MKEKKTVKMTDLNLFRASYESMDGTMHHRYILKSYSKEHEDGQVATSFSVNTDDHPIVGLLKLRNAVEGMIRYTENEIKGIENNENFITN